MILTRGCKSVFLSFHFVFTHIPRVCHSEHFLYFVFGPEEATPPVSPSLNRAHLSVAPESGRVVISGREQKLEEPFSSVFFTFCHLVTDVFVCEAVTRLLEFFTFPFGRPLLPLSCDRPRSSDFKKTTNKKKKNLI